MIGQALHVMTADTLFQATMFTIVMIVNVIIAAVAALIVRFVIRRFAWDAALNARSAKSLFVRIVQEFAPIAMKLCAKIV